MALKGARGDLLLHDFVLVCPHKVSKKEVVLKGLLLTEICIFIFDSHLRTIMMKAVNKSDQKVALYYNRDRMPVHSVVIIQYHI